MKTKTIFTKIPNNIGTITHENINTKTGETKQVKFSFEDTYRLTCLLFIPCKEDEGGFYNDSTFNQIADFIGNEKEETIKKFVERLKKTDLLKIKEISLGYKIRRNKYYMAKRSTNFRMIGSEILELSDLTNDEKGFLIQLFGICLNGTRECRLTNKMIAEKLGVSAPTITKYTKSLLAKNHLTRLETGYQLMDEYFIIKENNAQAARLLEIEKVKEESDNLKAQFPDNYISLAIDNTNWENILYPTSYYNSLVNGTANLTKPFICESLEIQL